MPHSHIVLFDGYCHLCDGSVKFILKNDSRKKFVFAALQSETGKRLISKMNPDSSKSESILYLRNGKILMQSDAALWIASELRFPACLLGGLVIVPPFLRNKVYDFIARNRYKWFGKYDQCMVPDEKFKNRFIDL